MKLKRPIFAFSVAISLLAIPAVTANAGDALTEDEIREITDEVGEEYGICPEFLQSIAFHESSYRPDAENGDCKGLMQVSEKWHKDRMESLGVTDIYDPYGNVLVAADYLAELFGEYEEADVVLMFYSGNSRATKYSEGIGEPSEYVEKVLEYSAELEREHGK